MPGFPGCSWYSETGAPPPRRVVTADDTLSAASAYRLATAGTGVLWTGGFPNARQLLSALDRRLPGPSAGSDPAQAFRRHREARARRARVLGKLLLRLEPGARLKAARAPDVQVACAEAGCSTERAFLCSLRDLLGMIGAHEWRRRGVLVPALGARIHPHHGVFSPVRGEYVGLVARAPLPAGARTALDIGTGTGVLAAVLARRGVASVLASDRSARAVACAEDNIARLGLARQVTVTEADVFPARARAPLVVCNPPWLPGRAASALDAAVYDPGSRMLRAFLDRLPRHLEPGGEAWLILSGFAEQAGLRTREELLGLFDRAGLEVAGRLDATPRHRRALDPTDPLHALRAAEVTSLWRLRVR
ncbi:class I SAM-dependent methyltransferase [Amycolatopsis sp. NBC_00345]|uniref:class I SAM-dependent methyltransferase n=1 Tax=Amycolatopsis sp. NBC_00345 TaxID=2975955 RepID=UPI002E26703A